MAEFLDRVVIAGVLFHELIAGEAEDGEFIGVRGLDVFVEGFEGGELGCESAFGGGVDDENDFAFKGGEGVGSALLYVVSLAKIRGIGKMRDAHCLWAGSRRSWLLKP